MHKSLFWLSWCSSWGGRHWVGLEKILQENLYFWLRWKVDTENVTSNHEVDELNEYVVLWFGCLVLGQQSAFRYIKDLYNWALKISPTSCDFIKSLNTYIKRWHSCIWSTRAASSGNCKVPFCKESFAQTVCSDRNICFTESRRILSFLFTWMSLLVS